MPRQMHNFVTLKYFKVFFHCILILSLFLKRWCWLYFYFVMERHKKMLNYLENIHERIHFTNFTTRNLNEYCWQNYFENFCQGCHLLHKNIIIYLSCLVNTGTIRLMILLMYLLHSIYVNRRTHNNCQLHQMHWGQNLKKMTNVKSWFFPCSTAQQERSIICTTLIIRLKLTCSWNKPHSNQRTPAASSYQRTMKCKERFKVTYQCVDYDIIWVIWPPFSCVVPAR